MIYILLGYPEFKHEIEELVKVFIPSSEYEFIDDEALVSDQSFLLKFAYLKEENTAGALFHNGKIMASVALKDLMYKNSKPVNDKDIKDCLKRGFYLILSKLCDYYPPWGILTGVRPTKIVNELLDKNNSFSEVRNKLKYYYYIRDDKIDLLCDTVKNQRYILETGNQRDLSIYIGIPFCPTRCSYCSFTAYTANEDAILSYLKQLFKEIEFAGDMIERCGLAADSLYIGGGTPTVLTSDCLKQLLSHTISCFNIKNEFTVECGRPDTITSDKLDIMQNAGVTRISINPQTMNAETLKRIGRNHTPDDIEQAYAMAKKTGIKAVNMDLIAGLPGETEKDFENTLSRIIELEPENITVHTLALKRASKLNELNRQNLFKENVHVEKMLELSQKLLKDAEYAPYYLYRQKYMAGNFENTGYSKKGHECIYNIKIMEEKQTIIALGAGGISKVYFPAENRIERIPNVSNYEVYIDRIEEMLERKRNLIFANIDNKNRNTL